MSFLQVKQGSATVEEASRSMEVWLSQARPLSALAALLREEQDASLVAAATSQDGCAALPAATAQLLQCRVRAVALSVPEDSQVLPGLRSCPRGDLAGVEPTWPYAALSRNPCTCCSSRRVSRLLNGCRCWQRASRSWAWPACLRGRCASTPLPCDASAEVRCSSPMRAATVCFSCATSCRQCLCK